MSKKTKKEIPLNEQTGEKLGAQLLVFKKELFNLRCQRVMGEITDTSRFKKVRREVARIKTELTKRLVGGSK
jgi:large subunit ribosomal protein L29